MAVVSPWSYPRLDEGFGYVLAREGEAAGGAASGDAGKSGEAAAGANGAAAGAVKDPFEDPKVQQRVNDIVARELAKVDRKYEKQLGALSKDLEKAAATLEANEAERKRLADVVGQLERGAGGGNGAEPDPEDIYEELERYVKPPDEIKDPVARRIWIRMKRGELSANEGLQKLQKLSEQQAGTISELQKKMGVIEEARQGEEAKARKALLSSAIDRSVSTLPHHDDVRGLRGWFATHVEFGNDGDLYYRKDGTQELLRLDDHNLEEIAADVPAYMFKPKTKGGSGASNQDTGAAPSQQDLAESEKAVKAAEDKARASGRPNDISEAMRLRSELFAKKKAAQKK